MDPEVQALLKDPRMTQVLKEMSESKMGYHPSFSDKFIKDSFEKLWLAGVLTYRNKDKKHEE